MEKSHRGKREQPDRKTRRSLRTLAILFLLLALAALAGLKWLWPLRPAPTTTEIQPPAQSNGTVSGAQEAEPEPPSAEPPAEPQSPEASVPEEPSPTGEGPVNASASENDLLLLVNSGHPLPEDYTVELVELSNGQSVAQVIYPALQQMFDDAREAGVYPIVASGFRTAEKQQSLMDEKVQSYLDMGYSRDAAEAEALKWVNAVGCSEHQSGLAVDINADGIHSAGYEVYAWLAENAWRYGFILRYPEDKTGITGTDYEPWHYRYVGDDAAREIYESGVCLEEYLDAA